MATDWSEHTDHDFVETAGLQGYEFEPAQNGWRQPEPKGFQAAAELNRRLTVPLRESAASNDANARRMEKYTRALIWLRVALIVLGVCTIVATIIAAT